MGPGFSSEDTHDTWKSLKGGRQVEATIWRAGTIQGKLCSAIHGNRVKSDREVNMATSSTAETMQFLKPAQERVEAALALQKELLEAYEQASRDWLLACSQNSPFGQT